MWAPVARTLLTRGAVPAGQDLIVVGGELDPDLVLSAYRHGLFPMGTGGAGAPPIGWWSPDPRGVLLPGGLHVSRSLARSRRRFEVSLDTDFDAVVRACADPRRSGRWITPAIIETYGELHRRGDAHSIEVRREGRLVGGLYGIAIGGLFAGESMFHRERDASKVALAALVDLVFGVAAASPGDPGTGEASGAEAAGPDDAATRIIDVQWSTPHLASLGVVEVARADYLRRLARATDAPAPRALAEPGRLTFS